MPETILVVDDDPDITKFIELNLRDAGYHVAVAGDGGAYGEGMAHYVHAARRNVTLTLSGLQAESAAF